MMKVKVKMKVMTLWPLVRSYGRIMEDCEPSFSSSFTLREMILKVFTREVVPLPSSLLPAHAFHLFSIMSG